MNTYIALLRGINVGGQKKIKMADLKSHLQELGFENVRTYIQSGNIIFESDETKPGKLEALIKEKIRDKYGFDVHTIVKSPSELEYVLSNNPFINEHNRDKDKLCYIFLSVEPETEDIEKLKEYDYSPEEYLMDGKTIYFYAPDGFARVKMTNNFFEKKLKTNATSRNWKTVNKLNEMAAGR